MRKLNIRWLGKLPYSEAYDLQLGLHKSVSNNLENDDYLLLLEHDNVITSGRTSKAGNLLVSLDHLEEMKIDYFNLGYPSISILKDLMIIDKSIQYKPDSWD